MRRYPVVSVVVLGILGAGCADKEAADPGMIVREEAAARAPVGPRTVRCACDADGGLHVEAPGGSRVVTSDDPTPFAEITLAGEPGGPIRRTKSLGFIGDGKLTPSRSHGGPWNVPDALLPPHRHVEPHYGPSYGGYRRGWISGASVRPTFPSLPGPR